MSVRDPRHGPLVVKCFCKVCKNDIFNCNQSSIASFYSAFPSNRCLACRGTSQRLQALFWIWCGKVMDLIPGVKFEL